MPPAARRPDIDWLRIVATWLLFVFHTAKVFDPAPFFHIRNGETSIVMMILAGFIGLWHMPLFFLLAGWSIPGSLGARGSRGFVRERVARLVVPLVAGSVCFGPIMKYLELSSGLEMSAGGLRVSPELQESFRQVIPQGLGVAPPFTESFLDFLPSFFTQLGRFTWGHLWFLAYLFVLSLVWLPLFRALQRRRPARPRVAGVDLGARRAARPDPGHPAADLARDPEPLRRLGQRDVLLDLPDRGLLARLVAGTGGCRLRRMAPRARDRGCGDVRAAPHRARRTAGPGGGARGLGGGGLGLDPGAPRRGPRVRCAGRRPRT